MERRHNSSPRTPGRSAQGHYAPWLACLACLALSGCTAPLFRAQSPDVEELVELDESVKLVRDLARPIGTNSLKIESVGLVTQLDGTGSDPPPGPLRDTLLGEMLTHEVANPHQVLASPDTSLVLVRGYLRPGTQPGDRFDVEILLPSGSETTSIRNGWLLPSRMREVQMLNNLLHKGHIAALAQGRTLADADFTTTTDPVALTRGRIPGGGVARIARPMGLVIRKGHNSVKTSSLIGAAINARFHYFDRGQKKGVAKPKDDDFIELAVAARYRSNIARYLLVLQSLAVGERPADRSARLKLLEPMLLEPTTAADASLQLEAIGADSLPTLRVGLRSTDSEVRFYAAEALAYLNEHDGVPALLAAAKDEPAFRWHALAALSVLDHTSAYDALTGLMHTTSAETRCGALRALLARNPRDPLVSGESFRDDFVLNVVPSANDPLIYFAHSQRPEIVIFGHEQTLVPPPFLFAGKSILIKALDDQRLKVCRFEPGREDRELIVTPRVADVVRAIGQLGGGYLEVLQALNEAKDQQLLASRLVVGNRARSGRQLRRESGEEETRVRVASPIPDLFDNLIDRQPDDVAVSEDSISPPEKPKKKLASRIGGWFGRE